MEILRSNDKQRVLNHYNRASPYYRSLWGEHLHHGYWIRGHESNKEVAQLQLVEQLAQAAGIQPRAKLLDIGCGFGASSIHLACKYGVQAVGITISPVQVEMANEASRQAGASATFHCMDAESMHFDEPFDFLWSIESISHYQDVPGFFSNAAKLLKPGGTFALTDRFKQRSLPPREHRKFLRPIEDGMLVELHTTLDYENLARRCRPARHAKRSPESAHRKNWDFCLDIIKEKSLWQLAARQGSDFLRFLRAFKAMQTGFTSGHFVYGLLVARKAA